MSDGSGGSRSLRGPPDSPRPSRRSDQEDDGEESDSDSDSVSATVTPGRLKRRRYVMESEDESDSSVIGGSAPKGCRPLQTDDESDDWTSSNSDDEKPATVPNVVSAAKNECMSDSSEGESDKCPVCLLKFTSQQIGTPDTCEHIFCSDCLTEWSNHVNTCPVDRKEFTSVLVRNEIGGKVIKTIPAKPRRISLDDLVEEQPTICQICHSAESEETMLLCDRCDLGFHMECLEPPLHRIPLDDWFCPECSIARYNEFHNQHHIIVASTIHPSQSAVALARSSRQPIGIPNTANQNAPSTSSSSTNNRSTSSRNVRTRSNMSTVRSRPVKRRKRKTRRTKTVVIEYEIRNGEKFPSKTKKYISKRRKKKVKRASRTVARRAHVRSSVKGRLAELFTSAVNGYRGSLHNISVPQLSIFGNRNELDIVVSDDEDFGSYMGGSNGTAVAVAPRTSASAILEAYRQNRRKTVFVPSPTYASSAPDILSSIMESQSLLHSKNNSMSLNKDGSIAIKVPKQNDNKSVQPNTNKSHEDKPIDLRKPDSNAQTKSVPAYGNSGRGGNGSWRGGRSDYQSGNTGNRSGRNYGGNSYQGGNSGNYRDSNNYGGGGDFNNSGNSFFNSSGSWTNNSRNQQSRDQYLNMQDRSPAPQRTGFNANRGRGNQMRYSPQMQRSRAFPPWQSHNFPNASSSLMESPSNSYSRDQEAGHISSTSNEIDTSYVIDRESSDSFAENRPLGVYQVSDERVQAGNSALPQPPIIRFEKPSISDDEKSEQEPDGDKYDPTEPTLDDSSSDGEVIPRPINTQNKLTIISTSHLNISEKESNFSEPLTVSPKSLDQAVQLALQEHEGLISACTLDDEKEIKEGDSDTEAECPNFSIYSTTSMDIAKNKKETLDNEMKTDLQSTQDDLIQEDDIDSNTDMEKLPNINSSSSSSEELANVASQKHLEEQKSEIDDKSNNKIVLEDNDTVQKGTTSLQTKGGPRRNIIKINLSSSLSAKKKCDNEIVKPNDSEKNDMSTKPEVDSTVSVDRDFNKYESLHENQTSHNSFHSDRSHNLHNEDNFTELISDIEDERSYTPCLDENKSVKSKDTSIEDNDKGSTGIEGLDTELISEDEGNEIFTDSNKTDLNGPIVELRIRDLDSLQPADFEEGEIVEKNKQRIKAKVKELLEKADEKVSDDDKKKKKKDKKNEKDEKERSSRARIKKDSDNFSFKKLSKSGKERNYREREDRTKGKDRRRSKSTDKENKDKKDKVREKKKEKRKDMERYDVRNIISDKNRRIKDAFGRDKSRPRSNSPSSRLQSPPRFRRSVSRRRSLSRNHRSASRTRRSISRTNRSTSKDHRSKSPHKPTVNRRSPIRKRRSLSKGPRSLSKENKSVSPCGKRSVSPRRRTISPRSRESVSPKKRISLSPRPRSPVFRNRRSISPRNRCSKSRNRRSISRNRTKRIRRSLSRNRRCSPKLHRNKSPRRRLSRRSRSKLRSLSRNRSRSPKSKKNRKLKRNRSGSSNRKSKSPIKSKVKRKRSHSYSPGIPLLRSLSQERPHSHWQEAEKSPLFQDWTSGSQSMSPSGLISQGWTPPPMEKSPEPQNLRVILTTKEKNKKKEKKKKSNKRNKTSERVLKQSKDLGPSKEVFTSGNNILVSVSFNKNKEMDNVQVMPPPESVSKKKKRKAEMAVKQKKDKNKEKIKKKRIEKEKRCKEIENKKPVAIIDLDKSPFKELTPSPKAVIVLSDSDNGEKEEESERQEVLHEESMETAFPQPESESVPSSPNRENNYVTSTGPKTPPEPPIKFTILSKSNPQLRSVNPLHEDEDENTENQETDQPEETVNRICETRGPNTPPDPPNSPPSSPDAYDPFEPTKSGSATPEEVSNLPSLQETEKLQEVRPEELPHIACISLEAAQKSNLSADDVIQAKPISPTEKVMALLKSTRASLSPGNPLQPIFSESTYDNAKIDSEVNTINNSSNNALQSPDRSNSSAATNKAQSTYSTVAKSNSPKPIFSTVAPTVVTSTPVYLNPSVPRIGVFSMGNSPSTQKVNPVPQKINLSSPTKSSPLKSQPPKLFLTKPSPIKSTPIKPMLSSKTPISKLPMPTVKPLPARNQKTVKTPSKSGQNGSEVINVDMEIDSPYSPGSSDFGDLFEPPSDNGKHSVTAPLLFPQKTTNKFDSFDSIFSIKPSSKNNKSSTTTKVAVRQIKKSKGKTLVGVKIDEDSLKILDDLPSSAVEMQVKSKFLKKLNRQERVVEEVKLVLKPHYNKKHINKEEYKDILRRAVPKICHNRSGEINPAKIQNLIEAYVKKFRKKALTSK